MPSSFFRSVPWAMLVEALGLEMFTRAGGGRCPGRCPPCGSCSGNVDAYAWCERVVMKKRGVRPDERRPFFCAYKSSNCYLRPEYSR